MPPTTWIRPSLGHALRRLLRGLSPAALTAILFVGSVAADDTLTAEQAADVDYLIHTLISPCCWTTSVAEHGSGQAPVVEADVTERVKRGESRDEIIDAYLAQYGERILVEPRRQGFNRIAYIVPWVAVGLGLLIIWRISRRGGHRGEPAAAGGVPPLSDRVRDELAQLDD